jgi:hypothetical protein
VVVAGCEFDRALQIEEFLALLGRDEHTQRLVNEIFFGLDPAEPRGLGQQIVVEVDVDSYEVPNLGHHI